MTTGGTGGFEQGSDYIAARVSMDVDAGGIQTLREMTQEIDRMRTSTEAAARSSANWKSYLDAINQAAQQATNQHRELASQLERTAEMQQRMMGGGGGSSAGLSMSRLAPGGYVDPWAGMGAGMGGVRPPSPTDVHAQIQQQGIDPTRQLDPRKYINAQAGRYNVLPGELPAQNLDEPTLRASADRIDARERQGREQEDRVNAPPGQPGRGPTVSGEGLAGRVGRYTGLASNIMNEMTPGGGSHAGMLNMAARGMQAVGRSLSGGSRASGAVAAGEGSAAEGGGTAIAASTGGAEAAEAGGGLSGMLGGAGMGLGAGLAGLAAFEKGGSMYQGYKNMGLIRGQGAGAGFGDEMSIRTMALNPFITTEQSRQIIMAGLTEGYSGKQFDTVTQFMASNLKDMNMSVADQVQLLRKNVNEGGQSIAGLGASLAVIKGLAGGNTSMSMPDMMAAFQQTSGSLVSTGMSGGAASQAAIDALGGWSGPDDQAVKGVFPQMVGSMGSDPTSAALMRAYGGASIPAGLNPIMTNAYLSQSGQNKAQVTSTALTNMVKRMMGNAPKGSEAYMNKIPVIMQMIRRLTPDSPAASDINIATQVVDRIMSGRDPYQEGASSANAVSSQVNEPSANPIGYMGEQLGAGWRSVVDIGKRMAATVTSNPTADENAAGDLDKTWSNVGYHEFQGATNPILDNVVNQLGAGNIQVVDGQGNASSLTGSKQQVSDLAAGKLKWRPKGSQGDGYTLQQTPQQGSLPGGGGQSTVNFNPAQVQITIDNQGRATASPNPVPLTTNQTQVNAGYGSSTLNNNPPNGYDRPLF